MLHFSFLRFLYDLIQAQRGVNRSVASMNSRPLPAKPGVYSSPDSSLDVRHPSSSSNEYTSAEFPPDRVYNPADDTTQGEKEVALEGRTNDDLVYESIPAVLFETCAAGQLHLISENAGLSESGEAISSSRKKQSNIGRLKEIMSCKCISTVALLIVCTKFKPTSGASRRRKA